MKKRKGEYQGGGETVKGNGVMRPREKEYKKNLSLTGGKMVLHTPQDIRSLGENKQRGKNENMTKGEDKEVKEGVETRSKKGPPSQGRGS